MRTTVTIRLPSIVKVSDYHEFDAVIDNYRAIGLHLKVEEVGVLDGDYIGIVHAEKDEEFRALKAKFAKKCEKYAEDVIR